MKKLPRFTFIISPISIFLIICSFPLILGQQPYTGNLIEDCDIRVDNSNSTSVLGYMCNGLRRTCQSYLTFRSQPPYNSVAAISALLSANRSQLAQLNSVTDDSVFAAGSVVLVPATCSCSGQLYQANASYTVLSGDTYLTIANNTFQGLSTCQALQAQNDIPAGDLFVGARLRVPLRCACPTSAQADDGVNFLLTYLLTWSQSVENIAVMFGVEKRRILAANSLSETNSVVFAYTTLVVPLEIPPTSFQVNPPPPPPQPTIPASGGGSSKVSLQQKSVYKTLISVLISVIIGRSVV